MDGSGIRSVYSIGHSREPWLMVDEAHPAWMLADETYIRSHYIMLYGHWVKTALGLHRRFTRKSQLQL